MLIKIIESKENSEENISASDFHIDENKHVENVEKTQRKLDIITGSTETNLPEVKGTHYLI